MNAGLRGADSDSDQKLVEDWCVKHGVMFHSVLHDLSGVQGIQEVARNHRRADMEMLLEKWGMKWIATAHHRDDLQETFFMRLFRGAGLDGLLGLKEKNNLRVRPLLTLSKKQIIQWAISQQIEWREDASNASSKYTRNAIRNKLIPLAREIDERSTIGIDQSISLMQQWHAYAETKLEQDFGRFITRDKWGWCIDKSILSESYGEFILSEWMRLQSWFDFQASHIRSLEPGKHLEKGDLIFDIDHDSFRLRTRTIVEATITLTKDHAPKEYCFSRGKLTTTAEAFCAAEQSLHFPLEWRIWSAGDALVPLGMKGKKKVSDLLNDRKLPRAQRDNTHVLLDQKGIVWVEGLAIADRVKMTGDIGYRFLKRED